MPKMCRFSINDVVKPTKLSDNPPSQDPSSPKLSCTGQIKTRSNNNSNRFRGNTLSASSTTKSVHSTRYTKLHNLFSGKNLISPAINNLESKCVTNRSKSCNYRGRIPNNKKKYYVTSSDDHDIMKVVVAEQLDPPLPVIKCRQQDQKENVNLWKRRGIEIKTLEIQPIQITMNRNIGNNNEGFSLQTSATTFWCTNNNNSDSPFG